MKYSISYVVSLQYLGFRFSGWQKQKNAKTLHDMVDKSLSFALNHFSFKTLGIGRTDAKVSANKYFFQLFLNEPIEIDNFLVGFNKNLSPDLKAISIKVAPIDFNILSTPKSKEYHYYFSFGEKAHPFSAPYMISFMEELDVDLMQLGAKLFEGEHYFYKYCTKPSENTILKRRILKCEIKENTFLNANFFPKKSYVLVVKGKGFLRYQIRLMMATLFELGKGNIDLEFIKNSLLENNDREPLKFIAPASGLQLYDVDIDI